jgi:hypothetical protein
MVAGLPQWQVSCPERRGVSVVNRRTKSCMSSAKENLGDRIEYLRNELGREFDRTRSLVDPAVLLLSTFLDRLIVEYQRLLAKESDKPPPHWLQRCYQRTMCSVKLRSSSNLPLFSINSLSKSKSGVVDGTNCSLSHPCLFWRNSIRCVIYHSARAVN